MEIEMVELSGKNQESSEPFGTLGSLLAVEYDEQGTKLHELKRKGSKVTAQSIGNRTVLPQVKRIRKLKESDANVKISNYIAQEEITDYNLFQEVMRLNNCCSQCDSTSNCISNHFAVKSSKFDFPKLCNFVRK